MSMQVAVILGAGATVASIVMAQVGRVLNPAWIVVFALYLIGPVGALTHDAGIPIPMVAILAAGPVPFVAAALARHRGARDRMSFLAPLALLWALAVVSLAWTPSPAYGVDKLTIWTLTGILPAVFIVVLAPVAGRMGWAAIVVVALVSAGALLAFGGDSPLYPGRLSLFGDNPIWTARAAFIGALVAIFGPFPRVVRAIAAMILVAAGVATVSLGPLLGLLAGAWTGAAVTLRDADRTRGPATPGWVALGLVSGAALVVVLGDALFGGDRSIVAMAVVNDPNVTGRAGFLQASLDLFSRSPFLGVGFGGFASTGLIEYPHNLVAEVASELGLVGLVALAGWFAVAVRGAARSPLLAALLVATAVFSLFSGSVASNAEFWMFSALAVANVRVTVGRSPHVQPVVPAHGSEAGAAT